MNKLLLNAAVLLSDFFKVHHILRATNRDKILIFTIHGVMSERYKQKWTPLRKQLDPLILENTLSTLVKHYTFVSMEDLFNREPKAFSSKPRAVITMDDGYQNNIDIALPILKNFGIKPTLFVSTFHISTQQPFWFDRLDYALQKVHSSVFTVSSHGFSFQFRNSNREELRQSYRQFRAKLKIFFSDDIEMNEAVWNITTDLEKQTNQSLTDIIQDDLWSKPATWSDLKACSENQSLSIGNHTKNHIRIGHVAENHCVNQLVSAKNDIYEQIGKAPRFFCYPDGSYSESAKANVQSTGHEAALTVKRGLNDSLEDPFLLKRIDFPLKNMKPEKLLLTLALLK